MFEVNLFDDIRPWRFEEDITITTGEPSTTIKKETDPFLLDLSMLKPQSPFISNKNKNDLDSNKSDKTKDVNEKTDKPNEQIDNLFYSDLNLDPINIFITSKPVTEISPTEKQTSAIGPPQDIVVNGFMIGNKASSRPATKKPSTTTKSPFSLDLEWSWIESTSEGALTSEKTSTTTPSYSPQNDLNLRDKGKDEINLPDLRPQSAFINLKSDKNSIASDFILNEIDKAQSAFIISNKNKAVEETKEAALEEARPTQDVTIDTDLNLNLFTTNEDETPLDIAPLSKVTPTSFLNLFEFSSTPESTTKGGWEYKDVFSDILFQDSSSINQNVSDPDENSPIAHDNNEYSINKVNLEHVHHDETHFNQLAQAKKSIPRAPSGNLGLSRTNSASDSGTRKFVEINNDIGFKMYRKLLQEHSEENFVFSPVSATSSLAMLFFGARGSTYRQINELLKMDEMISFNPHLIYKNIITDTLTSNNRQFTGASTKHLLVSKVIKNISIHMLHYNSNLECQLIK